jgi:hypothetical protein
MYIWICAQVYKKREINMDMWIRMFTNIFTYEMIFVQR